MNFVCETLKEKDRNGNLSAVGVRWSEARIFWDRTLNILGNLALVAGVVIALFGLAGHAAALVFGALLAGAGYGLSWLAANMDGVTRELWFRRDGTMPAPYGFGAYASRFKFVSGPSSDVVSIEAEQIVFPQPPAVAFHPFGVQLYKRSGQITTVAVHLDRQQAHMLAVKLTDALGTLRADMAASTIRDAGKGGDKSGNVYID